MPLTVLSACSAALRVLPETAVVSHVTAASLLQAPVRAGWPLEFCVPPGAARARRRGIRVHVRDLGPADAVVHRGLAVTSGPQTWLDLAATHAPEDLVVVGDALYRAGHLDRTTLAERLTRADGVRGVVRARECAPLLTPLSASRPESLVRYWLTVSDLPDPVPQLPVCDRSGRVVLHADLGWAQWKVALEYEGRQHADPEQFGRDLRRYTAMAADGWLLLRYGRADLGAKQRLLARAAAALRSHGATW